jgi:hypothetical protein
MGAYLLKYYPIVSNLPSKSDTIIFKLDVNTLKDLNCLYIHNNFRAEIAAEIGKIPKFSTFTRCNAV